jgi:hypothetical protein
MTDKIIVKGVDIHYKQVDREDYISITDIAKFKNVNSKDVIKNWIRNKETIAFIGLWETLNNPNFKGVEFDSFKAEAGYNSFTLSPKEWVERTNAIGIITGGGRYSQGIFAHKDIAFEFASWVSVEFKLYMIYEYQRLKGEEQKALEWTAKRELAKVNYHVHTEAIMKNLIVPELTPNQVSFLYADEADVLNVALFGKTAGDWRIENPHKKGNIRDYADVEQLLVLSNMESYNAILMDQGLTRMERIVLLNENARKQLETLLNAKIKREDRFRLPKGRD